MILSHISFYTFFFVILSSSGYVYDCRHFCAHMVIVVLVQQVVVSSLYDVLVFFVMVLCLFVF